MSKQRLQELAGIKIDELFEQFDKYQESLPDEYFNLNKIN